MQRFVYMLSRIALILGNWLGRFRYCWCNQVV